MLSRLAALVVVAGNDPKAALILFGPFRRKATTFMVLLLRGAEGMFVP